MEKRIVHAMKHITYRFVRASGICLLAAATPIAWAQTPAPTTPASAAGTPPAGAPAAGSPAAGAPADTSNEHTSYLFGLTFGEQMHSVGITNQVDSEAVARGVKDGLQGKKSTHADQQQIQGFVQSVMAESVARNKAAAVDFLAHNGHEKGVKTMADGLQYKVLIPGDAKAAAITPTDEVTVNYRGKLLDGSEFDSSYSRGTPATFKVNGVIKGWQEALVLMKPGSKWQLFVPPELAYDTSPRPGIPAGSLLTFDVELLSVKPSGPPAATPPSHKVTPPLTPPPSNQ
jgi:FKBP-type peptidyl-prolyl cis-trans isomerase FklB